MQKQISYEGARIHYSLEKNTPHAILFCHGDAQNHTAGLSLLNVFPENYTKISIDFPGHGRSEEIQNRTLLTESKLIEHILQQESIERVTLIGHSKGANLAATFATTHPVETYSIALLNPFFRNPRDIFWYLPVTFLMRRYLNAAENKFCPEKEPHIYGNETSEEAVRTIGFEHTPYSVLERNLHLYDTYDLRHTFKRLLVPTLILMAKDDPLTPVRHILSTTRQMKTARIERIPGTHNFHLLQKENVQAAFKKYLDFLLTF